MTWKSRSCLGFGFLALLILPSSPLTAQQSDTVAKRLEDSPRHHEWANFKTATGRTVRAFVVYPEVDAPAPAVVLIHENRGLTDWVRGVADRFAEEGFVAIAPDLLSEAGPERGGTESFANSDAARDALYALTPEQVASDLDAAVDFIRKDQATSDKVAVIGFCWGGGQAFHYAAHADGITAALVFYGPAPDRPLLEQIKAPVYGFYGGNDFRITGQVPQTVAAMKELGKKYEAVIYEGAGHAFMRLGEEPGAAAANQKAMQQAWAKIFEVLKR
ncbi:MAG: dienelactone hydrolase family protein [Thermoguttaceae bacterium]|nr:dienelactone hydrolase family protein [Thermoguttaceae bacterium]